MFNGWTFFTSKEALEAAEPRRALLTDLWTQSKGGGWMSPDGRSWVVGYAKGTNEIVMFVQEQPGHAWVSPPSGDMDTVDAAFKGYGKTHGEWDWLTEALRKLDLA